MKINIGKYSLKIELEDNLGTLGEEDMRDTCYVEKVLNLDSKEKSCKCTRIEDSFGNVTGLKIHPADKT